MCLCLAACQEDSRIHLPEHWVAAPVSFHNLKHHHLPCLLFLTPGSLLLRTIWFLESLTQAQKFRVPSTLLSSSSSSLLANQASCFTAFGDCLQAFSLLSLVPHSFMSWWLWNENAQDPCPHSCFPSSIQLLELFLNTVLGNMWD